MGLINFAKSEGSQAIQLFGRGVRLKGLEGCLKRSRKIEGIVNLPKYIELLETLTIFGVKAQYMEDFKKFLEMEDMSSNENIHEFTLPVVSKFEDVKNKSLRIIKVRDGINFKKQSKRVILGVPDSDFLRYLIKNMVKIDCRSKVQTLESQFNVLDLQATTEEHVLNRKYLPFLDYVSIFKELEIYKTEKGYYNLILDKDNLQEILAVDGWYSLIVPKSQLEIDSVEKLYAATDYCIMALKSYIDKFYKFKKEQWETPYLEYQEIKESDKNFISEYTISYTTSFEGDTSSVQLEEFINDVNAILNKNNGLDEYEKTYYKDLLTVSDFKSHLYTPLISIKDRGINIQVSPVSLNKGEKTFID
ncbi:restriction endonuclease subunit R, partial [Butyricicoccus sp. 1XD8-22]